MWAFAGLAASLQQLYAMSPAEAALTEALVSGQSLKEFAGQRQTTMNTVRTQLRSAAAKAGAKRQVDLVRVVLTGPAVWRQASASRPSGNAPTLRPAPLRPLEGSRAG